MRFPCSKTTAIAFAAALIAGAAMCSSSDAAPEVTAACASNFAALKVSSGLVETRSGNFVDVPESRIRFVQGGTKAGCVVVSFSAEAFVGFNDTILVFAVLDDTTRCEPDDSLFAHSTQNVGAWALNYVCTGVTPGLHTIKLQFRSRAGGLVQLLRRTVIVNHFR